MEMSLLNGLRILAVEQYGAAPFGTQALADLGAEVVKIENPHGGGDVSRSLGPYFQEGMDKTAASLFFQSMNRNKKSLTLDLSVPEGMRIFHQLAAGADAVATNLRGDVPAKLGLTYEHLKEANPALVCAHISAYGRTGSRAAWPGYDYLIQAEAGYFSVNGEPDAPPSRFGLSIVDFMTGYAMAIGLLSGVINARRTGFGRDVDVSLYGVGLTNLAYMAAWTANAGYRPGRIERSGHPTIVPCQLFRTRDSWIYIMANKEKFFPILCDKLGVPELAKDPRFTTFSNRLKNREILSDLLDAAFMKKDTADWMALLGGAVPAAPVLDVMQALEAPIIAELGHLVEMKDDMGNVVKSIGSPFNIGETLPSFAAPKLGQNTQAILSENGFTAEQINKLRDLKII
jgi:succinate--hydroxymethylglutarate CoA-transferase